MICNDKDFPVRFQAIEDPPKDIEGILLQAFLGNHFLGKGGESFHENDFIKIPRKDDQIQGLVHVFQFFERVQDFKTMLFKAEGKLLGD